MITPPYVLRLPFPPSLNGYYVNAARTVRRGAKAGKAYVGRMIGPEGVAYRQEVQRAVMAGHRSPPRLSGRLAILVRAFPPKRTAAGAINNNRRDLDNLWKCLLDALTKAGVVLDDALFDDIRMIRGNAQEHAEVDVSISRFDPRAAERACVEAMLPTAAQFVHSLDLT